MEQFHLQEQKSTEQGLLNDERAAPIKIKLYRKRWVILTIYIIYAAINALQWFEYSVIANIVMRYYGVSALAVDWTSIIYMALYMPMVIPASYFIDKKVREIKESFYSRLYYKKVFFSCNITNISSNQLTKKFLFTATIFKIKLLIHIIDLIDF